jgi:ABC-2 type transport system permease protein
VAESIRNIRAIAAKELRGYYSSPVAWVIFGLFAALFAAFFNAGLLNFIQQSMSQFGGPQRPMNINLEMIRPVLANTAVLILFIAPMITMRTYAEEKRSGTIELLLTSPLKDVEIVLGKFFGSMGMFLGLLAVTLIYMAILFLMGNPSWKPLIAGYFGLLLVGGSFISLGLFFSSMTNNQMVAGVASFVTFLVLWIIGWYSDSAGPFWSQLLNNLSIIVPFDDFGKGVIDTKHIIRYLSFIVLGLFLATKSVDSDRWRG